LKMGKSLTKLVDTEQNSFGTGFVVGGIVCLAAAYAVNSTQKQSANKIKPTNSMVGAAVNGGLLEYSVVYTDRALNLMSDPFKKIMREISATLRDVYSLDNDGTGCAIIPGSGTYAMEAVARQFATQQKVLVIRNGYFSYRWSDIFNVTKIIEQNEEIVMMATPESKESATPAYQPPTIEEVEAKINKEKPAVVFAAHVETATGIMLPNDYLVRVATAVHDNGGLFVLDCIASGTIWVDMKMTGVDVLISAPQKGWSGPACAGFVLLSKLAMSKMDKPISTGQSFACNLKQWVTVMEKYENQGFKYYTTLPTDALRQFHSAMMETKNFGWKDSQQQLFSLGKKIRNVLVTKGFVSVAAEGFQSPGVVVSYANSEEMVQLFKDSGLQIASGVPFKLNYQPDTSTFRLGLFGLDKISDISKCVSSFSDALDKICQKNPEIVSNTL